MDLKKNFDNLTEEERKYTDEEVFRVFEETTDLIISSISKDEFGSICTFANSNILMHSAWSVMNYWKCVAVEINGRPLFGIEFRCIAELRYELSKHPEVIALINSYSNTSVLAKDFMDDEYEDSEYEDENLDDEYEDSEYEDEDLDGEYEDLDYEDEDLDGEYEDLDYEDEDLNDEYEDSDYNDEDLDDEYENSDDNNEAGYNEEDSYVWDNNNDFLEDDDFSYSSDITPCQFVPDMNDEEEVEYLVKTLSIVPKNIKQIRIVSLLLDNKVIGYRIKTDKGDFDISMEIADQYGISSFKIEKAIPLHRFNGMLLSKSEIQNGYCVPSIADNEQDCDSIFHLLFTIGKN